ncbi:hypothetical protein ACFFRR_007651 [Megaselia abdita]
MTQLFGSALKVAQVFLSPLRKKHSILTHEQMCDYVQLTYLNRTDIAYILQKFKKTLGSESKLINIDHRYKKEEICNLFPELRHNPYSDRIFKVFSTQDERTLSFDEFMNLCSVFSENSPLKVKASWAFMIFDFDEDNQITENDLCELIDRLTQPMLLSPEEKDKICKVLLKEMDLQNNGGMNRLEFTHAISRMPDFAQVFSFKP